LQKGLSVEEKILEISKTCRFELTKYTGFGSSLTLDYVEHSPAHGYSDSETSIDIDKEKAEEIIAFLGEHLKDI